MIEMPQLETCTMVLGPEWFYFIWDDSSNFMKTFEYIELERVEERKEDDSLYLDFIFYFTVKVESEKNEQ